MESQTLTGTITYWNPARKFGFIESTVPDPNGYGYFIERYFLVQTQISFCGVKELKNGSFVKFIRSNKPPRSKGHLPFAARVYIFESEQQAEEIDRLMAARKQDAAPNPSSNGDTN